ncbi:MAG: Kdo hydroxylase family protein [Terriglobales bacterium]
MLSFHDWLKANGEFQNRSHLISEFEPMASWMCMTDTVSHAVLRGRLALEQTVLVLPESLQAPAEAPANVLAALAS